MGGGCSHAARGATHRVMAYIVMAYLVMVYLFMAYIVMAYIAMDHIVMAYIAMDHVVMAYIVAAYRMPLVGRLIEFSPTLVAEQAMENVFCMSMLQVLRLAWWPPSPAFPSHPPDALGTHRFCCSSVGQCWMVWRCRGSFGNSRRTPSCRTTTSHSLPSTESSSSSNAVKNKKAFF